MEVAKQKEIHDYLPLIINYYKKGMVTQTEAERLFEQVLDKLRTKFKESLKEVTTNVQV